MLNTRTNRKIKSRKLNVEAIEPSTQGIEVIDGEKNCRNLKNTRVAGTEVDSRRIKRKNQEADW